MQLAYSAASTSNGSPSGVEPEPEAKPKDHPGADWSELEWHPPQRRQPTRADGVMNEVTGKVLVWVLTTADMQKGHQAELCGFHLQTRLFDDDESGTRNQVLLWAQYVPDTASKEDVA